MNKKLLFTLSFLTALAFSACKKSKVAPAEATRADLTRDSIFLYAKQIYLWNTALPTYESFNPRKYTASATPLDNYESELFDIAKYSNPYEYKVGYTSPKFSYISDKADQNPSASIQTASVDTEGNGNDIGIRFGFYGEDANFVIYASAIYGNSPAEMAGFKRGDRITKINGVPYGNNFNASIGAISTAITGATVTLEGFASDGTPFNKTLNKAVFKSSPIYKARTITAGTKKIGYLAYARFSNAENSIEALNTVFNTFVSDGVTDLVIDLRFNGGGYVGTAEHLINLIAPSGTTGNMFSEHFNETMKAGKATILTNQPLLDANDKVQYRNGKIVTYADVDYSVEANTSKFAKKGSLNNVQKVVFIVSSNSASASELVINSLKPHMDVKIVGRRSYGKPVGFFPVTIENKYDVYFSLFELKNSAGSGGYYDGFAPDVDLPEVPSGTSMYEFGNVNDNYLKAAIGIIAPGITPTGQITVTNKLASVDRKLAVPVTDVISSKIGGNEFKGLIEDRLIKRLKIK